MADKKLKQWRVVNPEDGKEITIEVPADWDAEKISEMMVGNAPGPRATRWAKTQPEDWPDLAQPEDNMTAGQAALDVAGSTAITGPVKGVAGLVSLPNELPNFAAGLSNYMTGFPKDPRPMDKTGLPSYQQTMEAAGKGFEKMTGRPLPTAQTGMAKAGETLGTYLPGMAFPTVGGQRAASTLGGLGQRFAQNVAFPAAGAEGAGLLAQEYWPEAEPFARFAGGFAGGMLPNMIARGWTPNQIDPVRRNNVDYLDQNRVRMSAGQATNNQQLLNREATALNSSGVAGTTMGNYWLPQLEDFTAATFNRIAPRYRSGLGEIRRAGRDEIRHIRNRIGQEFDDVLNSAEIDASQWTPAQSQRHLDDLADAEEAFRRHTMSGRTDDFPPVVREPFEMMFNVMADPRRLDRNQVQQLRQRIAGDLRKLAPDRHNEREFLQSMQGIFDDMIESTIGDASLRTRWRDARQEWRKIMVIGDAVSRAGQGNAARLINPSQLRSADINVGNRAQNRARYAYGELDADDAFTRLAEAGNEVIVPIPNSGTPQRIGAMVTGGMQNMGVAGLAGGIGSGNLPMALGGAAMLAAPMVQSARNSLRLNPAWQRYMRQGIGGGRFAAPDLARPNMMGMIPGSAAQLQTGGQ